MRLFPALALGMASLAAAHAQAATAEESYKTRCSTCHDAGTAGAPRNGDKAEWARRNKAGTATLYQRALQGKPNTTYGVVTLRGVVDNAQQITRAEQVAAKTRGVRQIDNKLIPKDLFAWD